MALSDRRPLISAVTNRHLFSDNDVDACARLVEWSVALARADVDILQIRERGLSDAALAALVRNVVTATAATSARTVVNDRVDVALVTGAAGVHLPASAPPAALVRQVAGPAMIVGRSIHGGGNVPGTEREAGCDYLMFGTVFPSASKPLDHPAAGVEELRRACTATSLPVLAIGGVTLQRAEAVAGAGAAGVAAIGLFVQPWLCGGSLGARAARLSDTVASLRATFTRTGDSMHPDDAEA